VQGGAGAPALPYALNIGVVAAHFKDFRKKSDMGGVAFLPTLVD